MDYEILLYVFEDEDSLCWFCENEENIVCFGVYWHWWKNMWLCWVMETKG